MTNYDKDEDEKMDNSAATNGNNTMQDLQQLLITLLQNSPQENSPFNQTVNFPTATQIANPQIGWINYQVHHNHPCCHNLTSPTNDLVPNLQESLSNLYKQLKLPQVPWMDKGHDFVISKYFVELELDQNKRKISLTEIFDEVNGKKANKIFIEAQPGYGKSTLCVKLSYDWAVKKEYMNRFDLVFCICLRDLRNKTVEYMLDKICKEYGNATSSRGKELLHQKKEKILTILDGFDEVEREQQRNIISFLHKQNCTIVLTCRTGLFNVSREDTRAIVGSLSVSKIFYNKKINIIGINDSQIERFLQNFSEHCNAQLILNHLKALPSTEKNIFQCPLMLILLTYLATDEDIRMELMLTNRVELFKCLVNSMVKRSLSREGEERPEDFNLFDLNSESFRDCKNLLQEFGGFALKKLERKEHSFDDSEMARKLHKFGMLILNTKVNCFRDATNSFMPFHQTIVEFMAAYYLWREYITNSKLSYESTQTVLSIVMDDGATSLVLPFLISLCQDNLQPLCGQLQVLSCDNRMDGECASLIDIVEKSQVPIEKFTGGGDILPFNVNSEDLSSETKMEIVNLGMKVRKTKQVFHNRFKDCYSLKNVIGSEFIWLVFNTTLDVSNSKWDSFIVWMMPGLDDAKTRYSYDCLVSVEAKHKVLLLEPVSQLFIDYFSQYPESIGALLCTFTRDSVHLIDQCSKLLPKLINCKELCLVLEDMAKEDFQKVYKVLYNLPSSLTSLHIGNHSSHCLCIYLEDIQNSHSLNLLALRGYIRVLQPTRCPVSVIPTLTLDLYADACDPFSSMVNSGSNYLSYLPIASSLVCSDSLLSYVYEDICPPNFFSHLKGLVLIINNEEQTCWNCVKKCRNLERLDCHLTNVSLSDCGKMIECLHCLNLEEFTLWSLYAWVDHAPLFLKQLREKFLIKKNLVPDSILKKFSLSLTGEESYDDLLSVVTLLETLLESKCMQVAQLCCYKSIWSVGKIVSSIINSSKFAISYDYVPAWPYDEQMFYTCPATRYTCKNQSWAEAVAIHLHYFVIVMKEL